MTMSYSYTDTCKRSKERDDTFFHTLIRGTKKVMWPFSYTDKRNKESDDAFFPHQLFLNSLHHKGRILIY